MGAHMSAQGLGARIWGLLRRPSAEWRKLLDEFRAAPQRVLGEVLPLSLTPVIARAVARVFDRPFHIRTLGSEIFGFVFAEAIVSWLLILGSTWVFSLICALLARPFGGAADKGRGLLLAVYASVPGWVGGAFYLIQRMEVVAAGFVLYGVYVFFRGVEVVIKPAGVPAQVGYTILTLGCSMAFATLAAELLKLLIALI